MFKLLDEKSDGVFGGPVCVLFDQVERILERISTTFPEYTDHSIRHSLALVDILDWLLTTENKQSLSKYDLYVILASCALHDIGMAPGSTQTELTRLPDYERFRHECVAEGRIVEENDILAQYVRDKHHELSYSLVMSGIPAGASTIEILPTRPEDLSQLKEPIARVCKSHGESIFALPDGSPRPVGTRNEKLNVGFVAACLRLADNLHVTRDRTPLLLYRFVNPRHPVSQAAWLQHMSTLGVGPENDRVVVNAKCDTPDTYFGIEDFVRKGLDAELRTCKEYLRNLYGPTLDQWNLRWTEVVARSKPAQRKDPATGQWEPAFRPVRMEFSIAVDEILRLLMGDRLYGGNRWVCMRELLQNSLDAVDLMSRTRLRPADWRARLEVRRFRDADGCECISVSDSGLGMNEDIMRDYLSRVGRSYYQSPEFQRFCAEQCTADPELGEFAPISEFGIGLLSCFMVADQITLDTLRPASDPIEVTLRGAGQMFVVRRGSREPLNPGTTVTLRLREPVKETTDKWLPGLIRRYMRFCRYTIRVSDDVAQQEHSIVRTPPVAEPGTRIVSFTPKDDNGLEGYLLLPPDYQKVDLCQGGIFVQDIIHPETYPFTVGGELNLTGKQRSALKVARDGFVDIAGVIKSLQPTVLPKLVADLNACSTGARSDERTFMQRFEEARTLVRRYFAESQYDRHSPSPLHIYSYLELLADELQDFLPYPTVTGGTKAVRRLTDFLAIPSDYRIVVGFKQKDEDRAYAELLEQAATRFAHEEQPLATAVIVVRMKEPRLSVINSCGCGDDLATFVLDYVPDERRPRIDPGLLRVASAFTSVHAGLLFSLTGAHLKVRVPWDDVDSECYQVKHVPLDLRTLTKRELMMAYLLHVFPAPHRDSLEHGFILHRPDLQPPSDAITSLVNRGVARRVVREGDRREAYTLNL